MAGVVLIAPNSNGRVDAPSADAEASFNEGTKLMTQGELTEVYDAFEALRARLGVCNRNGIVVAAAINDSQGECFVAATTRCVDMMGGRGWRW